MGFCLTATWFSGAGDGGGYLFSSRLLLEPENSVHLGSGGRYWVSRAMLDLGQLLEGARDAEEARRVYRKLIAYNLPGQNLAQSRVDRIRISEE